jgi:hypothetical protein
MATTLTTYFYNGAFVQNTDETVISVNGNSYWTMYAEVAILYGAYLGADVVPAVQPKKLPPLMNVEFNANFYRSVGGMPTSKYVAALLIQRQDIFETGNTGNCLGTKFTFATPIVPEDCANDYVLVWSTNRIEMPYGPDMIYIGAQNGVSASESLC